jgi:hypothetical protein
MNDRIEYLNELSELNEKYNMKFNFEKLKLDSYGDLEKHTLKEIIKKEENKWIILEDG